MARIRTVKPEFWTSEQVMELSIGARLLFVGMWNFCDDKGVHPASFKTLKAEVFPSDDLLSSDIERFIGELISQDLLGEFEANGRKWWFVTGWHHQVINRPSKSRFPEPPRNAPLPSAAGFDDESEDEKNRAIPSDDDQFTDGSLSTHGAVTDDSLTERKGGEGKGKEENHLSVDKCVETGSSTGENECSAHHIDRATQVALIVRKYGIEATPAMLRASKFAAAITQPDADWIAAAESAKAAKPGERISVNYLLPKVADMMRQPSPRASTSPTRSSREDGRLAVARGIFPDHFSNEATNERTLDAEYQRIV